MHSDREHTVRVLGGMLALVTLMVLALILYAWQQNWFKEERTVKMQPAPSDALTMWEDIKTDMDSYYRIWSLDFKDADGNAVSLESMRGKPLALLYWASWCPDCTAVMPDVEAVARAAHQAGGQFQLVCRTGIRGESAQTATRYLTDNGIGLSTWLDENAVTYEALGLSWVPTVLYFSPEGMLLWTDQSGDLSQSRVAAGLKYAAQGGLAATDAFVRSRLIGEDGRVLQNFSFTDDRTFLPGNSALSEGQGLLMQYAVRAKDRQLFDLVYHYAQSVLAEGELFAWRIEDGERADKNALVDDLRIIGALMDADDAFGGYAAEAEEYADALKMRTGDALKDWYTLLNDTKAAELSLAYVDLVTLNRLAENDADWLVLLERSEKVLQGGMLDTVPLYYPRYTLQDGKYGGESIHTAEGMITLLHLAQAGKLLEETRAFLIDWVRSGPIFARYTLDGQPVDGYLYESTATYALMVLIGCEIDDTRLIFPALYRMEKARVIVGDGLNGAYAHMGVENASFDTLCSLLAWQAVTDGGYLAD